MDYNEIVNKLTKKERVLTSLLDKKLQQMEGELLWGLK